LWGSCKNAGHLDEPRAEQAQRSFFSTDWVSDHDDRRKPSAFPITVSPIGVAGRSFHDRAAGVHLPPLRASR